MVKKFLIEVKKSANEAIKIVSKKAVQKAPEATGDLIGNKIADKITSISKKTIKELPINNEDVEITTRKKDLYHQKKESKLLIN